MKPSDQLELPITRHNGACTCPLCVPAKQPATAKGTKHDLGKPRMDLLPIAALREESKVLTFGASKYSANNWRNGIEYSRLLAATMRHLTSFVNCETMDDESGLSHLAHARCCLGFLLEFESNPARYASFDDRPHETK